MTNDGGDVEQTRLLLDHTRALAPGLGLRTLRDALGWLGSWFSADGHERLGRLLMLDSTERREAEPAVAIELQRAHVEAARRWRVRERAERDVDWVRTAVHAMGGPIVRFHAREHGVRTDHRVTGALLAIARSWVEELERFPSPSRDERATRLRAAIQRVAPTVTERAWDGSVEVALSRRDAAGADLLRRLVACRFVLDQPFDQVRDAEGWVAHAAAIATATRNEDTVLELLARMSIARAAVAVGWTIVRQRGSKGLAEVVLQRGAWRCSVTKGRPRRADGKLEDDRLVATRQHLGLVAADAWGFQPDVVLRFWSGDRTAYVLGDAKRNASGDGRSYIEDSLRVAVTYATSYGHLLGLRHDGAGPFEGPINPAVTLFCRQGLPAPGMDADKLIARLSRDQEPLPFVLVLDLERHFGRRVEGVWDASVMKAWFERVSGQCTRS